MPEKTYSNILNVSNRKEFRKWLEENSENEKECWIKVKKSRPEEENVFYYLDAVEEALCFGWIDSTHAKINGIDMQRFGPRQKNSPWTELNKERVRRLENLGLMTERGRAVLPEMGKRSFIPDNEIIAELKKERVWSAFKRFPKLYQRVRLYNLQFYKDRKMIAEYERGLKHVIEATREGKMFGEWNDYGRLI